MVFTVREFHDLVRLLEKQPEWRIELRRLVLTPELLSLPEIVKDLAVQVRALTEAQRRTEEQIGELVQAQHRMQRRQDEMSVGLGYLRGSDLERRYRERAPAFSDDLLRKIRVLSTQEVATLLDEAIEKGKLSPSERRELLRSDLIVRGRRKEEETEVYLAVEVSVGVGKEDVARALERARLLTRICPTLPVVAGEWVSPDADGLARSLGVWQVVDGQSIAPNGDDKEHTA